MPLNLWKTVKRTLNDTFGTDIMETENQLSEGLQKHRDSEYEVGEFVNSSGDTVSFLKVTDFEGLLKISLEELRKVGQLSGNDISLLICGDKWGDSTKLLCQYSESEKSQSLQTAKFLGIYQRNKESIENIEGTFGPIF